eukprot:Awhi_evm1s12818
MLCFYPMTNSNQDESFPYNINKAGRNTSTSLEVNSFNDKILTNSLLTSLFLELEKNTTKPSLSPPPLSATGSQNSGTSEIQTITTKTNYENCYNQESIYLVENHSSGLDQRLTASQNYDTSNDAISSSTVLNNDILKELSKLYAAKETLDCSSDFIVDGAHAHPYQNQNDNNHNNIYETSTSRLENNQIQSDNETSCFGDHNDNYYKSKFGKTYIDYTSLYNSNESIDSIIVDGVNAHAYQNQNVNNNYNNIDNIYETSTSRLENNQDQSNNKASSFGDHNDSYYKSKFGKACIDSTSPYNSNEPDKEKKSLAQYLDPNESLCHLSDFNCRIRNSNAHLLNSETKKKYKTKYTGKSKPERKRQ